MEADGASPRARALLKNSCGWSLIVIRCGCSGERRCGALTSRRVPCSPEARVPPDHPLRLIRAVVDEALDVLWPGSTIGSGALASRRRSCCGLRRRSERQLMDSWTITCCSAGSSGSDAPVWDASTCQQEPRAGMWHSACWHRGRSLGSRRVPHFSIADPGLGQPPFQPKPGSDAEPPAGNDPGAPPAGRNAERNRPAPSPRCPAGAATGQHQPMPATCSWRTATGSSPIAA